jgi:Ser/Thr protein kinase RdoA (MazF antagonist)
MEEILKNWDIGKISTIEPIPSYWGKTSLIKTLGGQSFILKEKSDLSKAEQEANLLSHFAKAGAPVAVPIRSLEAECCVVKDGKIFCLYPKLPGEIVSDHYEGNATSRAKIFGEAIGLLHNCFLQCDRLVGYADMLLVDHIQDWAIPCIHKHNRVINGDKLEKIWRDVEQQMKALDDEIPKQLIHRDPNPANMLFDKGKLTGFVDFEMVVRGSRFFDVCYCGSSLLVSAYPNIGKMQVWPDLFHSLVNSYQDICPLTTSELSALYGTLIAIELLFAAFSLEAGAHGAAKCNASVMNWLVENRDCIMIE